MSIRRKKVIYLDNAASTPIDRRVLSVIQKAPSLYGNPSAFNEMGRQARDLIEECRDKIAGFLNARSQEIIFTSSGSESNNLAIKGVAEAFGKPGTIISTPIEHQSVLATLNQLKSKGWKIIYLKPDKYGLIDPEELKRAITPETVLVSIMYANNEIGTIEPIAKLGALVKKARKGVYPVFHTDACQTTGFLSMNVNNLNVDLLTFNGAKIYGPKGIGVLYARRGIPLAPLIRGGEQENGKRAGTENLPAIAGLAEAISLIDKNESKRLNELRKLFISGILKTIPGCMLNGHPENSLPGIINISFPGTDSERLLLELDKYGIYAGSGSACTSHAVEPSHVLEAIGTPKKYLGGVIRFSMGRQTTVSDVEQVIKILPKIIKKI